MSRMESLDPDVINLGEEHPACRVLGPGVRYGLWVQGCPLRCRECVSPQWIPFDGGTRHRIDAVATRILDSGRDGLTISGGEPFSQAAAVVALIDALRSVRDLSVLSYTGHTLEALRRHGSTPQQELLARLDVLIDGPYLPDQHADLAWRGSRNQRIHLLSDRHQPQDIPQQGAGLQFELTGSGMLQWLGVPPSRNFRPHWEELLAAKTQEGTGG